MRSRNIKPGFFKNEEVADMPPLARILYQGLWCYADKEGRFEWRPKKIKAEILPYDEVDINELLDVITCHGFVITFKLYDKTYGYIPTFLTHQRPHPHEAVSVIPSPDSENVELIQCHDMSRNGHEMSLTCRADILIPDILNPSSLIPDITTSSGKPKKTKRSQLGEDFSLTAELKAYAEERGLDSAAEFEAFKNHHTSKGNEMKDWAAAWRTWILNAIKFGRNNYGKKSSSEKFRQGFDGVAAWLAKAEAKTSSGGDSNS